MSKSVKFGKQGKKGVAGRKVASYESAREYKSIFLSREDRAMLENILYGQPKSADCECQVSTVPKVACVRNSVVAECDNSMDEVDRTTVRVRYCPKKRTDYQQGSYVEESVAIKRNLDLTRSKIKKRNSTIKIKSTTRKNYAK